MKTTLAALLLAFAPLAFTQAQPPVHGGPGGPLPHPVQPPAPALEPVKEYTGKVARLVINDDYVYDGFYLLNGADSLLVHFAPHLGTQVMAGVKTGATATVSGTVHQRPTGGQEIRMIRVTSNGRIVQDTMSAPPQAPPTESYTKGNGNITALQKDPEGQLKGLVVGNRTILHFAPGTARQLAALVQNGSGVSFTGVQKPARPGEASAGSYTVVRCKTITLNGQEYQVQ